MWGDIVGGDAGGVLWEGALMPLEILRGEAHPRASCCTLGVTSSGSPQASETAAVMPHRQQCWEASQRENHRAGRGPHTTLPPPSGADQAADEETFLPGGLRKAFTGHLQSPR